MAPHFQSSSGVLHAPVGAGQQLCGPDFYSRAVLRDGTRVCVRAIRAEDKERLRVAFHRLSPRSVRQRFFCPVTELTGEVLQYLTELDFQDHVGLVLAVNDPAGEILVAVGRFVRVASGADRAEVAFVVADEYQHRGAATLLLTLLVRLARTRGVRELVAHVLEENREMLAVLESSNLPLRQSFENGVRRVVLNLEASIADGDSAWISERSRDAA
jgi:acetyltransferase